MQAITIVETVAKDLADTTYITWAKSELTEYLNSAQRRICLARPDASSSVEAVQLVAGTKQSIPATARRLLDVVRNMGEDGLTAGKVITATDMLSMDLYRPTWHKDTAKTSIDHFMYDESTPDTFYVTPPVHAITAVYIEVKLAKNPTEITDVDNDAISIDDVYESAIRHWMLHRAYEKESDSNISMNESRFHLQAFNNTLGIKSKTDVSFSPSREIKEGK